MQTNIKGSYLYWHHFAVNQAEPRPDGAGPLLSRCGAGLQAARQARSTLSAAFCNRVFQHLEPPIDTFPTSGSTSVLVWGIATGTRETTGGKRLQPLRCCVVIFPENLKTPPPPLSAWAGFCGCPSHLMANKVFDHFPALPAQLLTPQPWLLRRGELY